MASKPAVLEALRRLVVEASFNWELPLSEFQDVVELLTARSVEVRLRSAPGLLKDWPEPKEWLCKLKQMDLDAPPEHLLDVRDVELLMSVINETNGKHFPEGHEALRNPFDQEIVASKMSELAEKLPKCTPNQTQLGYAQYISHCLQEEPTARVGVFMGPGTGKSRLASVIAWRSLVLHMISAVTFVYPNNYLKKREEDDFKPAFKLMGLEAKVRWTTIDQLPKQPTHSPKRDHLIILDESDKFMMERPLEFDRLTKGHRVVALTATPGTRSQEKEVLDALDFKVRLSPPLELQMPHLRTDRTCTEAEFLQMLKTVGEPALIFLSKDQLHKFKPQVEAARGGKHYVDEEMIGEGVCALDPPDLANIHGNWCSWQTKEEGMRAIDLRLGVDETGRKTTDTFTLFIL